MQEIQFLLQTLLREGYRFRSPETPKLLTNGQYNTQIIMLPGHITMTEWQAMLTAKKFKYPPRHFHDVSIKIISYHLQSGEKWKAQRRDRVIYDVLEQNCAFENSVTMTSYSSGLMVWNLDWETCQRVTKSQPILAY